MGKELKKQNYRIKEDETMGAKTKYAEVDFIKGIEDGFDNNQIMDKMNVTRGSRRGINARLNKLRQKHRALKLEMEESTEFPKAFDLKLYDTVTRLGRWYRVVTVAENTFTVAETGDSEKKEIIMKADYMSGQAGFIKRDFPEVKTYIDESLKRKQVIINKEFEEAVREMEKSGAPALEPEHKDCDGEDFVKHAELRFKTDMERYTNNVSKITGKMTRGEIVDLTDVTEYNKVVGKYE